MIRCKMDDFGDVLTTKDVHDILGIGYNKTYELLRTGAIKSFKIGRERKIPKECLKEYIDNEIAVDCSCNLYINK